MQKGINTPKPGLFIAAVFMMMAMAWLTVCTPFVFSQQQKLAQEKNMTLDDLVTEELPGPLTNTTEEKTESGTNTLSEYLHDYILHSAAEIFLIQHDNSHHADEYVAYHGELHSPPPDQVISLS